MATIEGTSGKDRISTKTTVPGQPFATNLDDVLNGYGSNDVLAGAGGADVMTGGTGDDRYYVENVGDVVIEVAAEGIDTVFTTLSSYTLGADVEELKFIGSGDFAGTGNDRNNKLYGRAGSDTLDAGGGNDLLAGGAGADVMIGGDGNDQYYVHQAGDVVTEAGNEGVDTVVTTATALARADRCADPDQPGLPDRLTCSAFSGRRLERPRPKACTRRTASRTQVTSHHLGSWRAHS